MNDLESLAAEIDREATVVAFTGAGISAPSGVPTFRGDDGVWERFEEGQFTYGRLQRDPAGFWADRLELRAEMFGEEYRPNAAHEALAELGWEGYLDAILTQNTDGLHREALENRSSEDDGDASETDPALLELHGNAQRVACLDCDRRYDSNEVFERAGDGELPPRCSCGGVLKPDVVLFGEQLPGATIQRGRSLARESDVFLAIGSSLAVEPAASLPRLAASNGATLAVINLESTPQDDLASVVRRESVTEVLPTLTRLVRESDPTRRT